MDALQNAPWTKAKVVTSAAFRTALAESRRMWFEAWAQPRVEFLDVDADPLADQYDTLLPGEAQAMRNEDPREIQHWIGVYSELVKFKDTLLHSIGEQRADVGAEGRLEVQHDDILLRREHGRLRRRLDFWLAEREKLAK